MASDLVDLWGAVLARINADTGSGGLRNATAPLITGAYNLRAPIAVNTRSVVSTIAVAVGGITTVTTVAAHGLTSGDLVAIAGSDSTPSIDGENVATVTTSTKFTLPVNVTVGGTAGQISRCSFPYIVYQIQSSDPGYSGFGTRAWTRRLSLNVFVEKEPDGGYDPLQRLADIFRRLEGDWEAQGTHLPSFGFDRFVPTYSGAGWEADCFDPIDSRILDEEALYHGVIEFEITNSKRAA